MTEPNATEPNTGKWSNDELKVLKKLWQKGRSAREIATELGRSRSAVVGRVHRLRGDMPALRTRNPRHRNPRPVAQRAIAPHAWSQADTEQLIHLWQDGQPSPQIAEAMGRTRSMITARIRRLRAEGHELRGEGLRNDPKPAPQPAPDADTKFEDRTIALGGRASRIIVVPTTFLRAVTKDLCLFFAADPLTADGPDMLVCGCRRQMESRKPYCAAHLRAEANA